MNFYSRMVAIILLALLGWRANIDWNLDHLPESSSRVDLNTSIDLNKATITLTNSGREDVAIVYASLRLGAFQAQLNFGQALPRGKSEKVEYTLPREAYSSHEPLYVEIQYRDTLAERSLLNVATLPRPAGTLEINLACPTNVLELKHKTMLSVSHPPDIGAEFIVPGGFKHLPHISLAGETRFGLENLSSHRAVTTSAYVIYRSLKPGEDPVPAPRVCPVDLNAQPIPAPRQVLIIPWYFIALITLCSFIFAALLYRISCRRGTLGAWRIALIRWSFSIFIVGTLFSAHALLPILANTTYWHLSGIAQTGAPRIAGIAEALLPLVNWFTFDGHNYDYFNEYVAKPLWLYMLTLNLLFIRFVIRPDPKHDKYWHLMMKTFQVLPAHSRRVIEGVPAPKDAEWRLAKIALLALAVKTFYFPVFSSWTISNTFHLQELVQKLTFSFAPINLLIVDTLIFIDVLVFTISYVTEAPQLKNQIKSVEPTLVGWLYCIICYPPLNTWGYRVLDVPLIGTWPVLVGPAYIAIQVAITLLWVIYVWATIALGTRASNLTNRGIISRGPYAYVRHPAYISKLMVWTLQGLFLGVFNFFLVLFFWYLYTVRAWTEERHLSADPDYIEYRKKVKWWFCPGIF